MSVVQMITTRDKAGVTYAVINGGAEPPGDSGSTIWQRRVNFASDKNHRAGGHAFVEAAREQERVANKRAAAYGLSSVLDYMVIRQ